MADPFIAATDSILKSFSHSLCAFNISFDSNDSINVVGDEKIVNIQYKVAVYKGKGTALLVFEYWE